MVSVGLETLGTFPENSVKTKALEPSQGASRTMSMPLGCTALCRPMRGLVLLSKLITAQQGPNPY